MSVARARSSGKVTQRDVARAAGVSHQTVSFVLNGRADQFKPETVAAVHRAIDELGYRRHAAARSMRAGSTRAFALILLRHGDASVLQSRQLAELCEAADATGRTLQVERWDAERLTTSEDLPGQLREVASDGLIINWTRALPPAAAQRIAAARIAHVLFNNPATTHAVRPDDFAAGRDATAALIAQGHRRIAYTDWLHEPEKIFDGTDHYSIHDRYRGYRSAMADAGLEPRVLRHHEPLEPYERRVVPTDWLHAADAPSAVVSYDDFGVATMLLERPQLAVAVFGERVSSVEGLPVQRWALPLRGLAAAAVGLLETQLADPQADCPAVAVAFEPPGG